MNEPGTLTPLGKRDLASVFHPMAQIATLNEQGPLMIVRGEGIYVWDEDGKQYIDGLAGLWCTSLGYGDEELAQTAYEQIKKLSYGHLFADKSHDAAMQLAEKLKAVVPGGFSKVFFGLSGSRRERYADQAHALLQQCRRATREEKNHCPEQSLSRRDVRRGQRDRSSPLSPGV